MQEILRKVTKTLKDEGIASVGKKARSYIKTKNILTQKLEELPILLADTQSVPLY